MEEELRSAMDLQEAGRPDEALAICETVLSLDPNSARALFIRGLSRADMRNFEAALADLETAIALDPRLEYAQGAALYLSMWMCHWGGFAQKVEKLLSALEAGYPVIKPYPLLSLPSSARQQMTAASYASADKSIASHESIPQSIGGDGKIRLGYFSGDFYDHAVSHLVHGLFKNHDRSKFETLGFAFGGNASDPVRGLIKSNVDQFFDITNMSARDITALAHKLGIHIAIDLSLYTSPLPAIFAHGIAPIQVNFLGCPGTSGSPDYDYIIGDRFVTPPEECDAFSERIVTMPHSYQVNTFRDFSKLRDFSRQELNLPDKGFVFCCFNQHFKITPDAFEVWMRLLSKVEGSVLWLLDCNDIAKRNLQSEAKKQGVRPDRLIFAPRMPLADHLSRHKQADLFLDTFHYNAHTTASDALWTGLPIVTRLGQAFASRVAASLLTSAGVPDMITENSAAYEALALELASQPEKLAEIRTRVEDGKLNCPLFDTKRYARNIESAFAQMWDRHSSGQKPASFSVHDVKAV